ncbi:M23 family metallopeptidase [Streptomyces profundus]|uniref:M23 family metallopeptidase n=1 Tax=Streptomyces profundus TaxID=2867410 RepID=UPI001D16BEF8|nr:M23 family metallopeptidase [Streptomyces sp. MA3_2.13]UED86381.1 M23 family metallopeptidase [Streptomyces sp. MA3_2.13]
MSDVRAPEESEEPEKPDAPYASETTAGTGGLPGRGRRAGARLARRVSAPLTAFRGRRLLARRAAGCTALGALAIAGPWAVSAIGHEDRPDQRVGEIEQFLGGVGDNAAGGALGPYFGGLTEGDESRAPWYWQPLAADEWAMPVSGYPISAAYGQPGSWAAGYHTGVDFALPVGTAIHSVGPGTVAETTYHQDYGAMVLVALDDGHFALFAHLSHIAVEPGARVTAESWLGDSGNTGRSTGPHLHFEIRADRNYGSDVDPLSYLAGHGVAVR